MAKESNRRARNQIGSEISLGRKELRLTLDEVSQHLGISESTLSKFESGTAAIPAEFIIPIAKRLGKNPLELLGESAEERNFGPFGQAVHFLQQSQRLGVDSIEIDRDTALYHLIPFMQTMYSGRVCITASSLKGLQQDSNHDFARLLEEFASERRHIEVLALFTHPMDGFRRELLEGRVSGSIVAEIFQGIRWARERLKIKARNIRLVKASPTIFSIFAHDRHNSGVGLLNPYPLMSQAFNCPSIIVRSVEAPEMAPGRARSLIQTMLVANFDAVWNAGNDQITVALEKGLDECAQQTDALLKREAESLRSLAHDSDKTDTEDAKPTAKASKQK